jgi:hypothetical protein
MKMKGLALETTIILIVISILALLTINLILIFIIPNEIEKPLAKREFLFKCEVLCKDVESLEYCRYYWEGDDWNGNGIKSEIIEVGPYKWYACEDRIYCFLLVPCEDRFGSGLKVMKKCRELLCKAYLEKFGGNKTIATKVLLNSVGFSAKCSKDKFNKVLSKFPLEKNWYNLTFGKGCE